MLSKGALSVINIIAAAARIPGCRVVVAGSVEEHCNPGHGSGARSPYSASKAAATAYATLFRDVGDLPVVVLRLAMVYGPEDLHDKRLMPYVIDSLLQGADPGPAEHHLKWRAQIGLRAGIERTVAWHARGVAGVAVSAGLQAPA